MDSIGKIFRNSLLTSIKDGVEKSSNTFLLSYSAVDASQMDKLRKDLSKVGARVYVSKNRIAQIALEEIQQPKMAEWVNGQTAFVWSDADPAAVSKTLIKFTKGCAGLRIQGGLLDGVILAQTDVQRLSDLPSREVLLSQVLQVMVSPLSRLAGSLNAKTRDLLSILKQLSEKKGGN